MNLKPLQARVLVEVENEPEKTKGGIYLPDKVNKEKAWGKVLAVGPDANQELKGKRVVFGKYEGDEVDLEGTKHRILDEEHILAIVEGD